MKESPLDLFLEQQGYLILDGGLATELEARGYDLNDALWSARLLADEPEAIRQVHLDYLRAGADVIITASYQATIPAFRARGLTETEAIELLQRSVALGRTARDEFWAATSRHAGRLRPLVAASVGPYGAYLADGSEYTGAYGLILAESGPDLFACETIPSAVEARALARLLPETPEMVAWFSFTGRDEARISDGTPFATVVRALDPFSQVAAVGINCTPPRFIPGLVAAARHETEKPIVVYPNSGETYDAERKVWLGLSIPDDFASQSAQWRAVGANLIGGCCRTGPAHIRQVRQTIGEPDDSQ
jgi:homocysteine S-methyltransferase